MFKIFIDFDGTITRQDVGDALFEAFGGVQCRDIIQLYRDGAISAVECFQRECDACGVVERDVLDAFLNQQEIDQSFVDFVSFCHRQNLEFTIVSDGMDYYIKQILDKHGIVDTQFYANTLELLPVNGSSKVRLKPSFPYRDEICDRCACCKRNIMLTLSGDDDIIVFIGEGYSDRCPAHYADIVFAKDDLLKFCQKENISYYKYQTFSDVVQRFEKVLSMRRPDGTIPGVAKRRRAELARREVFLGG
ncbi:MAG: MtnX-like HAD-IB family phosphatase [Ignavibacteriae bacterium]|nr:MtnX-like HAD-IB family phosphatase [Ignavibacteriota bacterium]